MDLREAEENGCPDEILLKCKRVGIKSIGVGMENPDTIDWSEIEKDIDLIITEGWRVSKWDCPGQLYFNFFNKS